MTRSSTLTVLTCAGLCLAAAGPAFAQPAAPASLPVPTRAGAPGEPPAQNKPEASRLIADLAAPDFAAREAASRALAGGALELGELEAQLGRGDLLPEQRARLLVAGRALFGTSDRGALGVQFDTTALEGTVIAQVLPGFPANATLKPRDRIKRISGVRVDAPDAVGRQRGVRPMVVARDPGEEVLMLIEREGQEVEVPVKLGRFRDLNNASLPSSYDLDEAWAVRRSLDARGRAIGGGASEGAVVVKLAEDWRESARGIALDPDADATLSAAPPDSPERFGLLAGGQPQGAGASRTGAPMIGVTDPEQAFFNQFRGNVQGQVVVRGGGQVVIRNIGPGGAQQVVVRNGQIVPADAPDRVRAGASPAAIVDAQAARLSRDIGALMRTIEALKNADRADRPEAERELLESRLKRAQTDLMELERRLTAARALGDALQRLGNDG